MSETARAIVKRLTEAWNIRNERHAVHQYDDENTWMLCHVCRAKALISSWGGEHQVGLLVATAQRVAALEGALGEMVKVVEEAAKEKRVLGDKAETACLAELYYADAVTLLMIARDLRARAVPPATEGSATDE